MDMPSDTGVRLSSYEGRYYVMSPVRIEGKERPINEIFSSQYVFTIPRYQRPYSWTTEQAT